MTALALLPLLAASAPAQIASGPFAGDPSVRVWLDRDARYDRGDRARVHVQSGEDGYLLVLHSDADGRVRVLFPLDPGDDDFVRGGETYEIRGRGDREAFVVDERDGSGVVLAAWSPDPFRFGSYAVNGHWDYRAIPSIGPAGDAELRLLDIVRDMSATAAFAYDAETYLVGEQRYARSGATAVSVRIDPWCGGCVHTSYRWRSGLHVGFSFGVFVGNPWWHAGFHYDPWWHAGFHYDPWWKYRWHRPYYAWHHPVHIYRPVIWIPGPRFHRHGIGVRARYAIGACRYDPFCRDRWDRGRPGIASGVFTGGLDDRRGDRRVRLRDGAWARGDAGIADAIGTGRTARARAGYGDRVVGTDGPGLGSGRISDRSGTAAAPGVDRSAVRRSGAEPDGRAGIARAIGISNRSDGAAPSASDRGAARRSEEPRDGRPGISRTIGISDRDRDAAPASLDRGVARRSDDARDGRQGISRTIGVSGRSDGAPPPSADRGSARRSEEPRGGRPGISRTIGVSGRSSDAAPTSDRGAVRRSDGARDNRAGISRTIGLPRSDSRPSSRDRSDVRSSGDRGAQPSASGRGATGRIGGDAVRSTRPPVRSSEPAATRRSGSGSISRPAPSSRSAPSVRSAPSGRSGVGRASSGSSGSGSSRARPSSRSGGRIGGKN